MQVDDLDLLHAKQLETTLEPALDRFAAVVVRLRVASLLGLQNCAFWQTTQLSQDEPDASLALTVAIQRRRVDVIERAGQGGVDGRLGVFLGDTVGERLGHVAQWGTPDRDRRDT